MIDDNESALLYRLRLIESARSEILLSTYSYYNDESGRDITCALFAAAERGVKIRIVADGFNEGKLNGFSEKCLPKSGSLPRGLSINSP